MVTGNKYGVIINTCYDLNTVKPDYLVDTSLARRTGVCFSFVTLIDIN